MGIMEKVFEILEDNEEVWETDDDGDVWAINEGKAIDLLTSNGIKNPADKLACAADYYVVDIF